MSAVLSIRVPKRLKEEMEKLKGVVDWREEIVSFLEERVRYYKRVIVLERVRRILERHPELPEGSAEAAVRGDRDSR